jgi:hypothetical protein
LTILEMLDRLEAEVVSLRARNRQLQLAIENGAKRTTSKRSTKKKKSKPPKKSKRTPKKGEQLQLPAVSDVQPDQKEQRVLGKRQALGRSILQLRKPKSSAAV